MYNKPEIEAKALAESLAALARADYLLNSARGEVLQEEVKAAFIKGCQYAATPSVVSGLQWVKASERLPDPELTVVARDIDTLNNVDQWDIYKMDQDHLEAIEWLDESSPAQPGYSEQQVRDVAEQLFKFSGLPSERTAYLDEIISLLNKQP